jgi:hypothetical protein
VSAGRQREKLRILAKIAQVSDRKTVALRSRRLRKCRFYVHLAFAVRWPSGRRRRFAKVARDSRTGLKFMISGPFFIGSLVGVGGRLMVLGPGLGTLAGTLEPMPLCTRRRDTCEEPGRERPPAETGRRARRPSVALRRHRSADNGRHSGGRQTFLEASENRQLQPPKLSQPPRQRTHCTSPWRVWSGDDQSGRDISEGCSRSRGGCSFRAAFSPMEKRAGMA